MTDPNPDPDPSRTLAAFAATLRHADIPASVLRRAEDLFLDWFASALAGKGARPVEALAKFWLSQGPAQGVAEVLIHRRGSSPLVAAAVNAAASHFAEQDDVHNGSVFHPAAVVFPAALALAVAQALGRSGRELLVASVAGYEVGIRVGEFLGRSHYKIFHTTGTAGSLAAAAAVGRLLGLLSVFLQAVTFALSCCHRLIERTPRLLCLGAVALAHIPIVGHRGDTGRFAPFTWHNLAFDPFTLSPSAQPSTSLPRWVTSTRFLTL